jgi:hypothetical protein
MACYWWFMTVIHLPLYYSDTLPHLSILCHPALSYYILHTPIIAYFYYTVRDHSYTSLYVLHPLKISCFDIIPKFCHTSLHPLKLTSFTPTCAPHHFSLLGILNHSSTIRRLEGRHYVWVGSTWRSPGVLLWRSLRVGPSTRSGASSCIADIFDVH